MKNLVFTLCTILIILGISLFGSSLLNTMAEEPKGQPYHKYYTSIQIREGDSLWSIAEKYNSNSGKSTRDYVQELRSMNRLLDDTIHEGNYLTIFYYSTELK